MKNIRFASQNVLKKFVKCYRWTMIDDNWLKQNVYIVYIRAHIYGNFENLKKTWLFGLWNPFSRKVLITID